MRKGSGSKEREIILLIKKVSAGIIASVIILTGLFIYNKNVLPGEFFLYETLPFYNYNQDGVVSKLFKFAPDEHSNAYAGAIYEQSDSETAIKSAPVISDMTIGDEYIDTDVVNTFVADESALIADANDNILQIEQGYEAGEYDVIGTESIMYQPETGSMDIATHDTTVIAPFHEDWLEDLSFLRKSFYSVEKGTDMLEQDFNGKRFIDMDMSIKQDNNEPVILIFHTHMYEDFVGSNHDNIYDGVFGLGEKLAQILRDKYGIISLHHDGRYDLVDGAVSITGAYERMEPDIKKILVDNPSIQVVIDIHRDGVKDDVKLETEINGETVAPIMFVNGLSKMYVNGVLKDLISFPNSNLSANLAFSFQAQSAANELYPGLARRIYLKPYRYSLHMLPKSLLVEIGAQTNTKEEAFRAIEPLADILARVLLGK